MQRVKVRIWYKMRYDFSLRFLFFLSLAIISLTSISMFCTLKGRLPPASKDSSLLLVVLIKLLLLVEPPKTPLWPNSRSIGFLLSETSADLIKVNDVSALYFEVLDFILMPDVSSEKTSPLFLRFSSTYLFTFAFADFYIFYISSSIELSGVSRLCIL